MFYELATIVRSHHEHYDGSGYPDGLRGSAIPPLSRIMIVADAFDAMTTNRIYKARKSIDEALQEIKELAGKQFDPEVVKGALRALAHIEIDKDINQLPVTMLEQERFAYFYKDAVSGLYNQNYLEVTLLKNMQLREYGHLDLFYLRNFSHYNKHKGWEEGDKFLQAVSKELETHASDSLLFRIFGDDFAILSSNKYDVNPLLKSLRKLCEDTLITVEHQYRDLAKEPLERVDELGSN